MTKAIETEEKPKKEERFAKSFEDFYSGELNTMNLEDSLKSIEFLLKDLTKIESKTSKKPEKVKASYQKAYCYLKRYILTGEKEDANKSVELFSETFKNDDTEVLKDWRFWYIEHVDWFSGSMILSHIYTGQPDKALEFAHEMFKRERSFRNLFRLAYLQQRIGKDEYASFQTVKEAGELVLSGQGEMGLLNMRTQSYAKFHAISRNALLMNESDIGDKVVELSQDNHYFRNPSNNLGYLTIVCNLLLKYNKDEEAQKFLDDMGFSDLIEATHQWKISHFYKRGMQRSFASSDTELFDLSYEIPKLAKELGTLEIKAKKTWDDYYTFHREHPEAFESGNKNLAKSVEKENDRIHNEFKSNEKKYYNLVGKRDMITELLRQSNLPIPKESFIEYKVG